ncbi:hypothetical protein ACI3QN_13155, partial [Propionibacterium freudenreichii]|uniref:hypothetical protein n=1 Tax=Propionibacterium freudenreichii TaxID=1744 RepID=UPI0038544614
STFKSRYCITRWNGFGDEIIGSKNEQELYGKTDPFTFRITKAELGFEEFDDDFEFSLGLKETQYYEQMKKTFLMQLDSGEVSS